MYGVYNAGQLFNGVVGKETKVIQSVRQMYKGLKIVADRYEMEAL